MTARAALLCLLALLALLALPALAAPPSPEVQVALTSLRPGERARLEAALGDAGALPLYRGDFTVDVKARTVKGKVALTLTPKAETEELLLRVTPNAAHDGAVVLSRARVAGAPARLTQPDASLYRVAVEPPRPAGEPFTLELALAATVPSLPQEAPLAALQGAAQGDHGAFSAAPDVLSLAGLMPMLAVEREGRLQEGPAGIGDLGSFEPSHFIVSVTAPAPWRVVSAGAAVGEVPQGDGTVRWAYAVAGAREVPLLLLRAPEVTTAAAGEVTVEAVTLGKAAGATLLEHATGALAALEARLGPTPYKTLRVVEARLLGGAGGMEFPGLVTVASTLLSGAADPLAGLGLDAQQAAMAQALVGPMLGGLLADSVELAVAHELAHQYVAMLVGSDPIAEPLADEALTQHLALLTVEWRRGRAAADRLRDGQLRSSYQLHRLLGGRDGRARRATHEFDSSREYAALVYGKAPLAFDAMRAAVGDEGWTATLRAYVEAHRYRWVTARTLVALAAERHPAQAAKLKRLAAHWWDEAHGDEDVGQGALRAGPGIDPRLLQQLEEAMKALAGE